MFCVAVLAIPQLAASVQSIVALVKTNWPDWAVLLGSYGIDTLQGDDGRQHLPYRKADARYLRKILFWPVHRGAGPRHDDLPCIFCLPHSLCGIDRSICIFPVKVLKWQTK